MWKILLLWLCTFITIQTSPSADFTLCTKDDKDCLINGANMFYKKAISGDPSLNIESLDPMYHEEMEGDFAALKYKFTNSTVEGSKDCKVAKFVLSMNQDSFNIELNCPLLKLHGIYDIDGKILTFPITGKGDYKMECKDYHIVIDSDLKANEIDGKKYLAIKNYKYSGETKGGMIDMKNLFNGQKELADNILKVVNEDWASVANELQGPVTKAIVKKIVKNFNKYFKSLAISTFIA